MTEIIRDSAPAGEKVLSSGPVRETRTTTWWQRNNRVVLVWVLRVAFFVAFLLIWQLLSGRVLNSLYFSDPLSVLGQLREWMSNGTLFGPTWITIREGFVGYLLGSFAGAVAGYILAACGLGVDV